MYEREMSRREAEVKDQEVENQSTMYGKIYEFLILYEKKYIENEISFCTPFGSPQQGPPRHWLALRHTSSRLNMFSFHIDIHN